MKFQGLIIAILLLWFSRCPISACGAESSADSLRHTSGFINAWGRTSRSMFKNASGAIPINNKLAVGPVSTFIGYNTIEKLRLGFGLSTTIGFSRRIALRGYGAYGFGDHRWKYGFEAEWSLSPVTAYFGSYPVHSIKAAYYYDLDPIGVGRLSPYPQRMPFRLSLRHNENMLYRNHSSLTYVRELSRRFAIQGNVSFDRFTSNPFIPFTTRYGQPVKSLIAVRPEVEGSYTIGGDIFQTFSGRINLKPYAPIIKWRLGWTQGLRQTTNARLFTLEYAMAKLTPIGESSATINILLHGTLTAGHAPYPLLPLIPSSPYVVRTFGVFALLDASELPADNYIDIHCRANDGGMILGRIPGIRSLGLSLTASVSAVAGSLSSRNDPLRSSINMPLIPGQSIRGLAFDRPYVEVGIGIDKFLGFISVEYVRRLNYTRYPGCRKNGVSLGIELSF